jgi:hypothetical protein
MNKNANSLTLSEVLLGLYDSSEDDPILNGTVAICSVMYGVRHFSYNGIKTIEDSQATVHRYTIFINYAKVYEVNLEEMRRYDVDVTEDAKGLQMKVKVIKPTKNLVKHTGSA